MTDIESYPLDTSTDENAGRLVSTGNLPVAADVRAAVEDAYARYRTVTSGALPSYYPALAAVDPNLFGIAVAGVTGRVYAVGDVDTPFTIMSIAKPFVLAIVLDRLGPAQIRNRIGVNATGYPFNSAIPIEIHEAHRTNPMVNSGAIVTTSLVPGDSLDEKWEIIVDTLSRFAGRRLALDEPVFASATESNFRNRALANLLASLDKLAADPMESVDLYTRQSSLSVTANDLALMAATLANGGINPRTGDRVISAPVCRRVLAVMATAGLYETSGDWLYEVGLPGKSGVGGGIVCISPGKGGLATFSPPLDVAGNSVRGQLVARFLAQRLGLDLFSSDSETNQYDESLRTSTGNEGATE